MDGSHELRVIALVGQPVVGVPDGAPHRAIGSAGKKSVSAEEPGPLLVARGSWSGSCLPQKPRSPGPDQKTVELHNSLFAEAITLRDQIAQGCSQAAVGN
jgi:hypothetical protein